MPRITPFEFIETPEYITAIIKEQINHDNVLEKLTSFYETLDDFVIENELRAIDTPYLSIPDVDDDYFYIEVGIPVINDFVESNRVKKGIIPAGKKIMTYYMGDNDLMQVLYDELFNLIEKMSLEIDNNVYEYYLNGLEYGKNHLLTKIIVPIKEKAVE
jgi:effector-binding domain-containing protein